MSGGFFRGTSAEQDTRFSNKQAKLLKTQKFAAELDHPVDMTKVNMDVIRPWIATRVTELLGFEDEVLINFVYGLLDGKVVDGKKIQIQLTGFMEKNTGKFMRELWGLLLSAQNNASGVPQQFLDAKEEELKKKKAESDRINQEIQKRKEKEGRDTEIERVKKMDGEANYSKVANALSPRKHSTQRSTSIQPDEERDSDRRHRSRTRSRNSPSPGRSLGKSPSNSRTSSRERRRLRNESVSPVSRRHSLTPKRQYRSPPRRSMSPERRLRSPHRSPVSPRRRYSPRNNESPSRHRPYYSRRRSPSVSRHRSPPRRRSPYSRRRSPSYERRRSFFHRRSPSPLRRLSPSPPRRRSPTPSRRQSPSPLRRRSPVKSRRISPSPSRRRSPTRRRSISPARYRSPSPVKRRSPLPRSPKPRRSPISSPKNRADSRISPRQRKKRSVSPYKSPSPSYPSRRSSSRDTDSQSNGFDSNGRLRREKRSPVHDSFPREDNQHDSRHKVLGSISRSQISHSKNQSEVDNSDHGVRSKKSPRLSESPNNSRKRSPRRDRSLVKKSAKQMHSSESPRASSDDEPDSPTRTSPIRKTSSLLNKTKDLVGEKNKKTFCAIDDRQDDYSPSAVNVHSSPVNGGPLNSVEEQKRANDVMTYDVKPVSDYADDLEYGPGKISGEKRSIEVTNYSAKSFSRDKPKISLYELELEKKSKRKLEPVNQSSSTDSEFEEAASRKHRGREKRKHSRSNKNKRDLDYSSESDSDSDEDKKKAKRRKEEKKLRKEERRRRHEEKHRKKLERRADKMKLKGDTVKPPSDLEKGYSDSDKLADEDAIRKLGLPNTSETEQKKLEIELREKALQTFRAKKATNN